MRTRHLFAFALALAAAGGLSSCVVPLASGDQNCVSYCTLLQGCGVAGAPTSDCSAWCTAFDADLKRIGCETAFDDATACVVGEGTCQAASCTSQTQAFLDCTSQFCASKPDDPACPAGS